MASNKNIFGLLYIDRNSFTYCQPDNGNTLTFEFTPDIVKNADVINTDIFTSKVTAFIQEQKLVSYPLCLLLSTSLLFEKDVIDGETVQKDIIMQTFVDSVPYDAVSYVKIPIDKGYKVIAVNRDLYRVIQLAFESQGFSTMAILPETVMGAPVSTIDMQVIKSLSQKIPSFTQFSFLSPTETATIEEKKGETNKKNRILLIFLIVCIVISVVLFLKVFGLLP